MKLKFEDHDKLSGQLKEVFSEGESLKSELFETWRNNIDFVNGNQVVSWDHKRGQFKTTVLPDKQSLSSTDYIYVTNELTPINRTIVSFMTRNKPTAKAYPSDPNDDFSVRRALVAENIQWAKWEMDEEYLKHVAFANWMLAVGTVFRKDSWNSSARGKRRISEEETELNSLETEEGLDQQKLIQEFGKIETEALGSKELAPTSFDNGERHWGDSEVGVLTGFNINVDFNAKDENFDWIEEYSLQDLDWVKDNYSFRDRFFTGRAQEVKAQQDFGKALEIDFNLRFKTSQENGKKPKLENLCLFREFYQAPKSYMPWNKGADQWRGAMVVMAGDIVLYVGPSHYKKWHPYTVFGYEPYLGRFWYKSLWEQLVPLQCRLNEINGAIVKNAKTVAKSKWTILEGTIAEGSLNGSEDKPLYYKRDPVVGAVSPQLQSGTPLPTQFFNERQILIDQMARIAGSNMILGGNAPTGITAGSALNLLLENSTSQFGPLINGWEKFIEKGQTAKLVLFQQFCREPRDDIYGFLSKKNKELTNLDVDSFCGETIEDNLTIEVEAGSSIPKSNAARQSQIMELAKMGVLGDVVGDPITNQQFLSEMGITEFNQTNNAEWEKIKWENSRMMKGQTPSPSPYDADEMHLAHHKAETQKPSYIERASPATKQLYQEHIDYHEQRIEEKQANAQNQQKSQMMEVAQTQNQLEIEKKLSEEQAKSQSKKEEMVFEKNLEAMPPPLLSGEENFNQFLQ